jgi:hypothetical protein
VTVTGSNIKTIEKAAKKVFGKEMDLSVTKLNVASSRSDRPGERTQGRVAELIRQLARKSSVLQQS